MRRQRSALGDDVAEGLSVDELHDHERVGSIAPLVEYRDDVRMDDRRRPSCLVGEACAERVVRVGAEQLDGDVAVELLVATAPHLARAALVDALDQSIALGEEARRSGRMKLALVLAGHALVSGCPQLMC